MMNQIVEMTMLIGQIREMHYLKDQALKDDRPKSFNDYQSAQDKLLSKLIALYEHAYEIPPQ